jgi:CBS domain-containing protein
MNIADILRHKQSGSGANVVSIAPDESVTALLARLAEHNVGALLVLDGDQVAGIVSERDVVRRIAERGAAVLDARVRDIMTTTVVSCTSQDTLDTIAETMTERRVRHMPVVDDGTLIGIVSIGDVVSARIRQLEKDRGQLEQYITS